MNLKQLILDATDGGLSILLDLYPSAKDVVNGKQKKFKIRESERTPSATIRKTKDEWKVCDFGGEGREINCFDAYMSEHCITSFSQCLWELADRYHVDYKLNEKRNKPKTLVFKDADSNAKEGDFTYIEKKPSAEELEVFGPFVTEDILKRYNYIILESYSRTFINSKTKRLTTMTETSSEDYPIFMHRCIYKYNKGTKEKPEYEQREFSKIYKPLAYNKADRFFYVGQKPKDYINGLEQLQNAYEKNNDLDGNVRKFEECIICSGERDAMNIAGMGYFPIWLNSETASFSLSTKLELYRYVKRIYNIPDIDETGLRESAKLALEHLDIYTIELPQWIKDYRDRRGNSRKDLRDYLELRPNKTEFKELMNIAQKAKFWTIVEEEKKGEITTKVNIETISLLYYLHINGFYKYKDPITKDTYIVRVQDYKIKKYEAREVRDFIRTDMKKRRVESIVLEAYINSKKTTASIYDDLDRIDINFTLSTPETRTLFFQNVSVEVSADKITETKNRDIKVYTLEEKIIPHSFHRLKPSFTFNDGTQTLQFAGNEDGTMAPIQSNIFKFLINTSRIYWRQEFEERQTGDLEEDKEYRELNKFNIGGTRLKREEVIEQVKHLLNKLFMIGYLMHCYKFNHRAFAIWIMENKLTEENESSGGSGKSFIINCFKWLSLANVVTMEGRKKKLTENNHFMERVSSETNILHIDDASRQLDFNTFYTMICGSITINPKNDKSFELDYKDAPNIVFTSNFAPPDGDPSTMRRILPVVYSDYYHIKTDQNNYLETRTIADDFGGRELMGTNYTEDEYNADINFFIDCLQFYLQQLRLGNIIKPPMENVNKRIATQIMGDQFREWADSYFTEENGNLNKLIVKDEAYRDYCNYIGKNGKVGTPTSFKRRMIQYAQFNGYTFNPVGLNDNKNGRILIYCLYNGYKHSCEMIYLQTEGSELNNSLGKYDTGLL